MRIQHTDSTNFGVKVPTLHVLEITTLKVFENDGFAGMTNTLKKLYNVPEYTGHVGYRHYAEIVREKILAKYNKIAEITNILNKELRKTPKMSKQDAHYKACSLAAQIGEEVDIVI